MLNTKTEIAALGLCLLAGCAGSADHSSARPTADADPIVGTAYYGLSIKDCNQEFVGCLQNGPDGRFVTTSLTCRTQLVACLGDVAADAAGAVLNQAQEVTACGRDGLTCYGDARQLGAALDCHNQVQVCVNGSVKELTGIELPTTREVVTAAAQAAEGAAETAVDVAHTAVQTAADAANAAIDTAVDVADTAVTTAVDVAQDTAETAIRVADAATYPARHTLECTVQAQLCRWNGDSFRTCTQQYQSCLFAPPESGTPASGAGGGTPVGGAGPGFVLN